MLREQTDRVRQSHEESELLQPTTPGHREPFRQPRGEYEELLDKSIKAEEANHVNVDVTMEDLKNKLESHTPPNECSDELDQRSQGQMEFKANEIAVLTSNNETLQEHQ